MAGFLGWLKDDWFNLVQSFCLVGGFFFAAKAWRIQFLTMLADKHRAVCEKIMDKPELHRIFAKEADLTAKPTTPAEELALDIIMIQYETGWEAAEFLDRGRLLPLANDIRKFFALPLPHAAWEKNKDCHHPRFVKFVTRAIEDGGRLRTAGD
jgi:hypothetical protein